MPVIPWSNMLCVGVQDIDNQHRTLVDILNRLGDLVDSHDKCWDESAVLTELVQYTQTHFKFEEDLMRRVGYAGAEAHEREHRELFQRVAELTARSAAGVRPDPEDLLVFLRDWLSSHIMGTDRALGLALNKINLR